MLHALSLALSLLALPLTRGTVVGQSALGLTVSRGAEQRPFTSVIDAANARLEPAVYRALWSLPAGESVLVPYCAGRKRVLLDGHAVAMRDGPFVLPLSAAAAHTLTLELDVSSYEHRVACGADPVVGRKAETSAAVLEMRFDSPHARAGGGRAVVVLPERSDGAPPLLVGLPPWNGSVWTYAAYAALLREADAAGVALLFPSNLGNSLYTADAEDEVILAMGALRAHVAFDDDRVSLFGASMGGAGATTIGFHHPDRFAGVTSFFGDSRYDLSTYVRAILPTPEAAHLVNALDVVENASMLPVWLIHGDADHVSNIVQSELLAKEMERRGYNVRFDRIKGAGHEGELVTRFAHELVARAASQTRKKSVDHVTYRGVRRSDTGAYGVSFFRTRRSGDAVVEVVRRDDGIHLVRAEGVREVTLEPSYWSPAGASPPPLFADPLGVAPPTWKSSPP